MHKVEQLEGLVVEYIDIADDELLITTKCGRRFHFFHYQDCCENVRIVDSVGNLKILEGKKLISVEHNAKDDIPKDVGIKPYESYTWTEITFKTDAETVISRWIGESNGYYSEWVDFEELK